MTSKRRAVGALIFCFAAFSLLSGGAFASNDPLFGQQWGLHRIEAERAWGAAASGDGVVVAVIDTGVDFGHPDLVGKSAGALNAIQRKESSCESAPGDNNGHGTQVAGIIAANANDGHGIASAAPGARILSVKALDCRGAGYISDVSNGIRMAARNGARVINLSLGYEVGIVGALFNSIFGEEEVRDFQAAINEAARMGAAVVAAAGNDALQSSYAGMENVLVVGASGPEDEAAFYSSSGAEVIAPGGNAPGGCGGRLERCIATTARGGGHAAVQGTSFSAPHIAGVAALLFRQGHNAPEVRSAVLATADSVPAGPRVNAARVVGAPAPLSGGGVPGPGVQSQGSEDGNESLPAGAGPASPAARAAAAKAKDPTSPMQGAAGTPGAAVPGAGQTAETLVLPAPQGPPPELTPLVTGTAEGAGAGGRAGRLARAKAVDVVSGRRNVLIAVAISAAAVAGGTFFWKKRRIA